MRKIFGGISAFLQTQVGVIVATNAVWFIVIFALQIKSTYLYIVSGVIFVADIFIANYLFDRLVFFFSQFVLPIQTSKHRQEIYARVKNFDAGSRGPALFIKNGRVIMHEGEANKRGPGLIVLDTASAAVLRTDTEIKDTAGPGVKFTKANEYIAGSVDLRSQWQFIGPTMNSEQQTNGLTRDGFEISATISIKFRIKHPLENKPTESGVTSQYGYNETSVRNAITREVVQLGGDKSRMEWNKLPAHLVVNIWREYVRKFKLSDLFSALPTSEVGLQLADKTLNPRLQNNGELNESGLQIIERMINKRARYENLEALDETGAPTKEWVESPEFKQLQTRGLEISEVRIHNVHFDSALEEQIVAQWSAEWLNIARKEEAYLREKETLIETGARDEAGKNFARLASKQFSGKSNRPQENPFKTLQLLIQPLKEHIIGQSAANSEMESETRKLDEIWKWLLDNSAENSPQQEGKQP